MKLASPAQSQGINESFYIHYVYFVTLLSEFGNIQLLLSCYQYFIPAFIPPTKM